MVRFKARAESLGRTENEIKSEMAAALSRISATLTGLIEDLHKLRKEIQSDLEPDLSGKKDEYRTIHSRARLYHWYLTVQREAIGIRNHDSMRELYPIPPLDI